MSESAQRIATLARHNAILQRRDPGHLLSYLIQPLILMVVLRPVFARALEGGVTQVVTGLLVVFSTLSLSVVGTATLNERTWHTWDLLRGTAARPWEIVVGKSLPVLGVLVLQQAVLLTFGVTVIGMPAPRSIGLLALAVGLWSVTLLTAGTALALIARSLGELGAISDITALAISALGGAFAPISTFPPGLAALAHLSPGHWALALLQAALDADPLAALGPALVLLGIALSALAFITYRLTTAASRRPLL